MELMNIPDMKPKEGLTREILIDTESKARVFAESHKLTYDRVQENLNKTEKILMESKLSSKEIDWDLILLSGAYLGELIRINLGGSWIWDEHFSICFVVNIRGQSIKAIDPLSSV